MKTKLNEIYDELLEIASNLGIVIRKEKGNFKSGYCVINDAEVMVINKGTPIETQASILARALKNHIDNIFVKPSIREFIEKEAIDNKNDIRLEIKK